MARKKAEPMPLFAVKHDFVESLDTFCQKAVNLSQMVQTALELKLVMDPLRAKLQVALDEFNRAMLTRDED